jgi:stage II sporulation protein D
MSMLYRYNILVLLVLFFGISDSFVCAKQQPQKRTSPAKVKAPLKTKKANKSRNKSKKRSPVKSQSTGPSSSSTHSGNSVATHNPEQNNAQTRTEEAPADPSSVSAENQEPPLTMKRSCQIRVLLDEATAESSNRSWRIMAKGGGVLIDERGLCANIHFDSEMNIITYKSGAWYFGSKRIETDRLLVRPSEGSIMCDGVPYYGSLYLVIENNKQRAMLINCLDLEDYVYSVVYAEGLPCWPLEMNKALAIAIRTYAAEMIYKQTGKARPYHIKSTIIHQVYAGKPSSMQLRRAVDETRGIILTYDEKPIIAMYHICCGGVVPAHTRGINFKQAPYLARTKPCTFCKGLKNYHWQVTCSRNELETLFQSYFPHLGRLRHVRVARTDKSGVVQEVEIIGRGGVFRLSGKKIYAILKGAHSACFTIEQVGRSVIFKGRGYGHHMGMCQLGACELVKKQQYNFKQVLCFYYPGARFMRIKDRQTTCKAC